MDKPDTKNAVYRAMLWWTLPVLRNITTLKPRAQRRTDTVWAETTLLGPIPLLLASDRFTEADLHFYHHQARWYVEQGHGADSMAWNVNAYYLSLLAAMMPADFQARLTWRCPERPCPFQPHTP